MRFRTDLRDRFRIELLTRGRSVATADRKTAWEFLQDLLEAVPYQVHTILTDNSIQFAEQPRNRNTIYSRPMRFDMIYDL
jgi:hypothetical protein